MEKRAAVLSLLLIGLVVLLMQKPTGLAIQTTNTKYYECYGSSPQNPTVPVNFANIVIYSTSHYGDLEILGLPPSEDALDWKCRDLDRIRMQDAWGW